MARHGATSYLQGSSTLSLPSQALASDDEVRWEMKLWCVEFELEAMEAWTHLELHDHLALAQVPHAHLQ
jgi:hypothetical protein